MGQDQIAVEIERLPESCRCFVMPPLLLKDGGAQTMESGREPITGQRPVNKAERFAKSPLIGMQPA
jgi:hypothetical protein